MIRKRFGRVVALFSVILCIIAPCLFSACNKGADTDNKTDNKTVELVEFSDTEVKCDLNKEFSFASYLVTLDKDGNRYVGTAAVTDGAGNSVETAFNRFEVSKLQTYTVVISVKIAENDVRTRRIFVIAIDPSMPVITFLSEPYRGKAGVEYSLPVVKAEKKGGEELTPVMTVLLLTDDENGIEQQINDDKFTPVSGGSYRIIVTVTDSNGVTVTETRDFTVDEAENSPRDPARDDIY